MANYNCVEPANAPAQGQSVVLAQANDSITFPAVNSCFAVAFVLANGRLVGGHVPMFLDTAEADRVFSSGNYAVAEAAAMAGNLAAIVNSMNGLRGGNAVALAVTLGDAEWNNHWTGLLGGLGNPNEIRLRKPGGTRNVIVNGATQNIAVESGGHGHYAAVAGSPWGFAAGAAAPADTAC